MSLLDCAVSAVSHRAMDYFIDGQTPQRNGNVAGGTAPAQLFKCADGLLNLQAGTDAQFARLCLTLEVQNLLEDPRFASGPLRLAHSSILVPVFERMFSGAPVAHWYAKLVAGGVICSPVYDVADAFQVKQIRARGLQVQMERSNGEALSGLRNPIRFSGEEEPTYNFPPSVGERTDTILAQILGLSAERIMQLRVVGAI